MGTTEGHTAKTVEEQRLMSPGVKSHGGGSTRLGSIVGQGLSRGACR